MRDNPKVGCTCTMKQDRNETSNVQVNTADEKTEAHETTEEH